MTTHRSHRRYWILLFVLVGLGLPGACQQDKPLAPPSAGGELRIERLESDATTLQPGDSAQVRAWVLRGSDAAPVPGAAVVFREMPERGSGTFSKLESATDPLGWAVTTFWPTPGTAGQVTVRAQAGESVKYLVLQVVPISHESTSLEVGTADDRTGIPADGRSELEVTVTATTGEAKTPIPGLGLVLTAGDRFQDQNGNGVFDAGDQLIAAGDRNGNGVWDAEGTLPETAQTDAQGIARFVYRAGTAVGPVYLRMTGGGTARELILEQHGLDLTVTVTPEARELLADGISATGVSIRVSDWEGGPVTGVVVKLTAGEEFTDANGDGFHSAGEPFDDADENGEWDANGTLAAVATTDWDGRAEVEYRAGVRPGPVSVRATTTGGWGAARIDLVAVPPAGALEVELAVGSVYADGTSRAAGTVRAHDLSGRPLAGKSVRMSAGERFEDVDADGLFTAGTDVLLEDVDANGLWTPLGTLPETVVTGEDGEGAFDCTAGRTVGRAWIRAAADGISVEAPLDLMTAPAVGSLSVNVAHDHMTISGGGGVTRNVLTAQCLSAGGGPVPPGMRVTFRISSGPGGGERLEGAVGGVVEAETGGDGRASATLLSGTRSGWVQVRTTASSFYQDTGLYIDPGPAAFISCYADSVSLVPASHCWVSAWVYDAEHNPVLDGTAVHFLADEGLVVPANGGLTVDGRSQAMYTSVPPEEGGDGRAVITASADGGGSGVVACQSVILVQGMAEEIARLTLYATLAEIGVQGTGALEQSALVARAYDGQGDVARAGRRVLFRLLDGPGGGEHLNGVCSCDTASALTDELGFAYCALNSGTRSGTVRVQVESALDAGVSASVPVAIAAGPPYELAIGAEECNVLADAYVNVENDLVALVYDRYHNPVPDGTVVYFTTDRGMVEGDPLFGLGSAPTIRGRADAIWRSTGEGGLITVTASTRGAGVVENSTRFIGSGDPYATTFLLPSQSPVNVFADGQTEVLMRVQVLDRNSLYCLPATVKFRAAFGDVPDEAETADGCNASYAEADYKAPRLEQDFSYTVPDDGIGAVDLVTATGGYGPFGDSFEVRLRTGSASPDQSTVEIDAPPPGAETYFSVTVKDTWGNPLGGHVLSITATGGVVSDSGTTDEYGAARNLLFVAPAAPGTVYLEVRDLDPEYGGNLILREAVTIAD